MRFPIVHRTIHPGHSSGSLTASPAEWSRAALRIGNYRETGNVLSIGSNTSEQFRTRAGDSALPGSSDSVAMQKAADACLALKASLSQLMEAVATGDEAAFTQLHCRVNDWFGRICSHYLTDKADIEDAMQSIHLSIWSGAVAYDGERHAILGWLKTIARNRSIDVLRRSRCEKYARMDSVGEPEDAGPSPVDYAEGVQTEARLTQALLRLDNRRRRIVMAFYFGEQSHARLAQAENLPLGSVKSLIRRGLMQMREYCHAA